jgi:Rho GDP-dissociation inhibitor
VQVEENLQHRPNFLQVEGRPDIIIDLSQPGQLETLKSKPFTIKEGAKFRMKVKFKVQNQILPGMKYIQVVKRMGISSKTQEMIGSYGPNTSEKPFYEKTCKMHNFSISHVIC